MYWCGNSLIQKKKHNKCEFHETNVFCFIINCCNHNWPVDPARGFQLSMGTTCCHNFHGGRITPHHQNHVAGITQCSNINIRKNREIKAFLLIFYWLLYLVPTESFGAACLEKTLKSLVFGLYFSLWKVISRNFCTF